MTDPLKRNETHQAGQADCPPPVEPEMQHLVKELSCAEDAEALQLLQHAGGIPTV
jgi:hypothetical protein